MRKFLVVLSMVILLVVGIAGIAFEIPVFATGAMNDSGIDYTESLEDFNNPERGFYKPVKFIAKTEGNTVLAPTDNLVHLRVGIGAFSGAYNGVSDMDFTPDMLNTLDATLNNIRQNHASVIIRFAYDDFEGIENVEASSDQIARHISQLSPIFQKNQDVIACVETGFIGPYGEMHSSVMANKTEFNKLIGELLAAVPANRTISVRQPQFYSDWQGIDISRLNENVSVSGTDAYRVGVFNDGYLGSSSDYGTFRNRTTEVSWLSNQTKHSFYGGEVVDDVEPGYNTADFASNEMFQTHTTYLNSRWNQIVLNEWKAQPYTGSDPVYAGQSGFTYISNHLGYRYVVRQSELSQNTAVNGTLQLHVKIENVGAGNMINEKNTELLLVQNNQTYSIPIGEDVRNWNSREIREFSETVTLPAGITTGTCDVFMKVSNGNQNVRFANNTIWNSTYQANYMGNFTVTEAGSTEDIPTTVQIAGDTNGDGFYDADYDRIVSFLQQNSAVAGKTNGQVLGTNVNDPAVISGITWNAAQPKRIATISLGSKNLAGSMDVSGLTELTSLDCSNNKITSLIFAEGNKLTTLRCDNNPVQKLDVSTQTALSSISFTGMTALREIKINSNLTFTANSYGYLQGTLGSGTASINATPATRSNSFVNWTLNGKVLKLKRQISVKTVTVTGPTTYAATFR